MSDHDLTLAEAYEDSRDPEPPAPLTYDAARALPPGTVFRVAYSDDSGSELALLTHGGLEGVRGPLSWETVRLDVIRLYELDVTDPHTITPYDGNGTTTVLPVPRPKESPS